ncbi:MAG: hypothetical protein ACYC2Y_00535 [Armatimonadota bacterium]
MKFYMVQITHPHDETLDVLGRIMDYNPTLLPKVFWGEIDGEPMGWALVEAGSEEEARNMLPANLRDDARISDVHNYSLDDVWEMRRAA